MIKTGLDHLLARIRPARGRTREEPPVEVLLDVDREYREKAGHDLLPRIAPRRFNPEGEAWLPVLHTDRGKGHFTALHSNTARAHELGRVRGWVVIYFHDDDGGEAQRTVVTETRGSLLGRRVVRGRERERLSFYEGLGAKTLFPHPWNATGVGSAAVIKGEIDSSEREACYTSASANFARE